jgi:hypothetical protein
LADSEDATGKKLKDKARSLAQQVSVHIYFFSPCMFLPYEPYFIPGQARTASYYISFWQANTFCGCQKDHISSSARGQHGFNSYGLPASEGLPSSLAPFAAK